MPKNTRIKFEALIYLAVTCVMGALVSAQETWSLQASATTRALWGAAYGGGQFVAVGHDGTIVTSRDGRVWTARDSGTNAWLLAVEYVAGQFVVVGDAATVLVSPDAVTWRKVAVVADPNSKQWTFQPRRFNAVAAADFRWLGELMPFGPVNAAGEDGIVAWGHPIDAKWAALTNTGAGWIRGIDFGLGREVRVGRDGVLVTPAYSSEPDKAGSHHIALPLTPRVGTNLEGVRFARERFVAVGQDGSVFVSADATNWNERARFTSSHLFAVADFNDEFVAIGDGGAIFRSGDTFTWTRAAGTTSRALRAVAAAESLLVAVGDGGTIVTSPVAVKPLRIVEPPGDATTNAGGAAGFRAVVAGSNPVSYQWYRDGFAVPGATEAALALATVGKADAGRYWVRATNAAGAVESAAATLAVTPSPAMPIVDPTFRGDASLRGTPRVLLPLPDGRVVRASSNPQDADFTIDPAAAEVLRLLSDGRIDPTFRRGAVAVEEFAWRPTFYLPYVTQLLLQPDGKIVVTGYFGSYNGVAVPGMVRLETDGNLDSTFRADITLPRPPQQDVEFSSYAPLAALQPDGKIVYVTTRGEVARLNANGSRDPDFLLESLTLRSAVRTLAVNAAGRIFVGTGDIRRGNSGRVIAFLGDGRLDPAFPPYLSDPVDQLYPTADGGAIVTTRYDSGPIFPGTPGRTRFPTKTFRLRGDGSLDPALPERDVALIAPPAADGRLLLAGGKLVAADGVTETMPKLGAGYDSHVRVHHFTLGGELLLGGDFTSYSGVPTNTVARLNLATTENFAPPRIVAAWADHSAIRLGESVRLKVAAIAEGPVSYMWLSDPGPSTSGPVTEPWHDVTPTWGSDVWNYSVRVSNSAGAVTSAKISVRVEPGDLRISSQARRVSLTLGKQAEGFNLVQLAPTSHPVREEWRRDGQLVNGPPSGVVDGTEAGNYIVTFTDVFGQTVTSEPIVVTVGDVSRFTNLSTRAQIGTGERAAILGFVIPDGVNVREVLIRGVGSALAQFGVGSSLPAPRLEVFRRDGALLARANAPDVWSPMAAETVGAFPLSRGGPDASVKLTLRPGAYTARLSGIGDSTGVGLIELYEADDRSERLANISSRVFVGPGVTEFAIAGFTVRGTVAKRMLVRAAGPALAAFGVGKMLANPRLEIRDAGAQIVAANDDWQTQNDASVASFTTRVGAFPFAPGSKDSAVIATLAPGNYTAIVSGNDGGSGVALVDVYELP